MLTRLAAAPPIARAALGSAMIAFSGIYVALAALPPSASAFFRCAYALPALVFLARRERPMVSDPGARRAGLAAGAFFTGDLTLWHLSIDAIGAGLATVLASTQVVVVPLAAWAVLGEKPSRRALTAIPALMSGVVVISGVLGTGASGPQPLLGALAGAGAGCTYAGFLLCLRRATAGGRRPAGALRDASAVAMTASAVLALLAGQGAALIPAWPSAGWLLALGLGSQVVAWLLITRALGELPSAVGSVVLTLQPVASLALGAVLLGERPTSVQIAGGALVLGAVIWASGWRPPHPRRATVHQPVVRPGSIG